MLEDRILLFWLLTSLLLALYFAGSVCLILWLRREQERTHVCWNERVELAPDAERFEMLKKNSSHQL